MDLARRVAQSPRTDNIATVDEINTFTFLLFSSIKAHIIINTLTSTQVYIRLPLGLSTAI